MRMWAKTINMLEARRWCTMWNNKTLILKDSNYMNPQVTEWVSVLLVSAFLYSGASSDGKVWFSSVQRGISLNLELNSRFSPGHFAEPQTGPTVQVWFRFKPIRTLGVWEIYFWPLFQSKSLENVNIHLIYLILDRGRLPCYDFCLINGC